MYSVVENRTRGLSCVAKSSQRHSHDDEELLRAETSVWGTRAVMYREIENINSRNNMNTQESIYSMAKPRRERRDGTRRGYGGPYKTPGNYTRLRDRDRKETETETETESTQNTSITRTNATSNRAITRGSKRGVCMGRDDLEGKAASLGMWNMGDR